MKRLILCLSAFLSAVSLCFGQEVKIGEPLPKWQEGELDIHFISTGHGETTFMIFPDGTTFLTDASGNMTKNFPKGQAGVAEWKPNDTVPPGEVITNYINYFSPEISKGHINYFLLTLHREDHMGQIKKDTPDHSSGEFKLSSLCEIGSKLIMDNIFDRDWPSFNLPKPDSRNMVSNYRAFLDWTKEVNGTNVEKWAVGSSTQIVPLHDKSCGVIVRNLAGNGCVATGEEGGSVSYMPPKAELEIMEKEAFPDESLFSCAYMLSYGQFDFFLGGDLRYKDGDKYSYKDAETPLLPVIHKVEVMNANSHGVTGTHSADFINKLAPDVWLVGISRAYTQPAPGPMGRVIKANPNVNIFCTYQDKVNLGKLVAKLGIDDVKKYIVSRYGHVVIRVAKGGDSYIIYTLEDSDEEYTVKSIHGPYVCGD